jgi:hypothetical protein
VLELSKPCEEASQRETSAFGGNCSKNCTFHQNNHGLGSGLQPPWNSVEQPELLKELLSSWHLAASSENNKQKKVSPDHDQQIHVQNLIAKLIYTCNKIRKDASFAHSKELK